MPGSQKLANAVAPDVLDRQFIAERVNQKWIADFTYIRTAEGWLYVAAGNVWDNAAMESFCMH